MKLYLLRSVRYSCILAQLLDHSTETGLTPVPLSLRPRNTVRPRRRAESEVPVASTTADLAAMA